MQQLTRSEFITGVTTVGTSAARLTPVGFRAWSYVLVQADANNGGIIYVGHTASVSASNGFALDAGESVEIPIDDSSKIWIIGSDADQDAKYLVV